MDKKECYKLNEINSLASDLFMKDETGNERIKQVYGKTQNLYNDKCYKMIEKRQKR